MTKESVRKCSHCGHNGHNSRTCNNGKGCSFKLFGVRIDTNSIGKDDDQFVRKSLSNGVESSIRKSKSMGNLQAACNNIIEHNNVAEHGYLSEGQLQSKSAHDRKKGTPWTENEHRSFLVGLKKLGKGDWRGISRNYVPTRTPTQVASHAQKYYIRMSASEKKKRRSSVFDMPLKEGTPSPQASPSNRDPEISLQLCTSPPTPMKNNSSNIQGQASTSRTPPSAMFDRPPLSPVARPFGMPDFCCPPYMVGYPRYGLGIHTNEHMSTVFEPGLNYVNHYYVYQTNGVGPLVTFAPSRSQASSGLLPQPLPHGPSQAALASTAAKKDGLTAGIGALSI